MSQLSSILNFHNMYVSLIKSFAVSNKLLKHGTRRCKHFWSNFFHISQSDNSLFRQYHSRVSLYSIIYVDDLIITGSNLDVVHKLILQLANDHFSIKDIGKLIIFSVLKQGGHLMGYFYHNIILHILKHAKMIEANSISTPLSSSRNLSKSFSAHIPRPIVFRPRSTRKLVIRSPTRFGSSHWVGLQLVWSKNDWHSWVLIGPATQRPTQVNDRLVPKSMHDPFEYCALLCSLQYLQFTRPTHDIVGQ